MRLFDIVARGIDRPPSVVQRLAFYWRAGPAEIAALRGAIVAVILLRVLEADGVAAPGHLGEAQLGEIVLPATDRTDLVKSGLVVVYAVAATGTRKLLMLGHDDLRLNSRFMVNEPPNPALYKKGALARPCASFPAGQGTLS
jgi:hypothetical protein